MFSGLSENEAIKKYIEHYDRIIADIEKKRMFHLDRKMAHELQSMDTIQRIMVQHRAPPVSLPHPQPNHEERPTDKEDERLAITTEESKVLPMEKVGDLPRPAGNSLSNGTLHAEPRFCPTEKIGSIGSSQPREDSTAHIATPAPTPAILSRPTASTPVAIVKTQPAEERKGSGRLWEIIKKQEMKMLARSSLARNSLNNGQKSPGVGMGLGGNVAVLGQSDGRAVI